VCNIALFVRQGVAFAVAVTGAFVGCTWCGAPQAYAISIELKDVAPDRIERQRAFVEGRLPLPGTPDTKRLAERLAESGLKSGSPMLIRIFKEESELEIWMEKGGTYVLFATYPICHWSGTLGPKIREGDKQTPEGFYTITRRQLYHVGRWPISISLGFPNAFDRAHNRGGSYILVHGGCSSVGCIAMTNAVISEVYGLARAALNGEQRYIPVHVFPFRMTLARLAELATSNWNSFWQALKAGYDSFDRTRRPPRVSICEGRYRIEDAAAADPADDDKKGLHPSVLDAVREACPEPVVATAVGRGAPQGEFMSKLGGPVDAPHRGASAAGTNSAPAR
jgi:murein L,D-transpeptidase YafK